MNLLRAAPSLSLRAFAPSRESEFFFTRSREAAKIVGGRCMAGEY